MADEKQLDILYQWTTVNHLKLKRGKWWYLLFLIIIAGSLTFAFWTSNFLLVIIVTLLALIILVSYYQPTREIQVVMAEDFFLIEGKEIPYRKIKHFWFAEFSDFTYLYLVYKINSLSEKQMSLVLLGDTNPLKIREIFLEKEVEEDLEPEEYDTWANWSRLLRL